MTQCKDATRESSTAKSVGCARRAANGNLDVITTLVPVAGTALAVSVGSVMVPVTFGHAINKKHEKRTVNQCPDSVPATQRSSVNATVSPLVSVCGAQNAKLGIKSTSPSDAVNLYDRHTAHAVVRLERSTRTIRTTHVHSMLSGYALSVMEMSIGLTSSTWVWVISFEREV